MADAPATLPRRHAMLGRHVHAMTQAQLLAVIAQAVTQQQRLRVNHLNLHGLRVAQRSVPFARMIDDADIAYIDGMPLVWAGRLMGHPFSREHRITGIDYLPALLQMASDHRWKVFLLGHHPQVLPRIHQYMQDRFPQAAFASHHGYFDEEDSLGIVEQINQFAPHLLILGMGMPRQESWLWEHQDRLRFNVSLCLGATFDYFVGAIPTPPRWMGRVGLEWLYRLASEPRRLAGRYLIEPWFLLFPLLRDVLRARLGRKQPD